MKQNPNAFFVFLTGIPNHEFIEHQRLWLKWQKCGHHVHIIEGYQPVEKIAALFNLADMFVTAPETDFLAQSLLEGMACGSVPICRNLSVYGTRVREGVTGRIVPDPFNPENLAATIVEALENRDRLNEMSRNASEQALALDDERIGIKKMAEVYARVTGRDDVLPKNFGRDS